MNFFGISVFKFQMQLSNTFRCLVIEASFHCDPDYQFLCFVPAPEYVARLTEFSHQLLDMYSEEPRMNNFAFNKTRRGLHISLIYEDDGRSQFDMRRKKNLIEAYKQKYSKVAICLTDMIFFPPWKRRYCGHQGWRRQNHDHPVQSWPQGCWIWSSSNYSEKTTPQENVEEEIRNVTETAVVVSGEHSEICVDNCFPHLVYFMSSSSSYQKNQK